MRTTPARSGWARTLDSGDGHPARQSVIRFRECEIGDLSESDDGHLLIGIRDRALKQLIDDSIEPYPIRSAIAADGAAPGRRGRFEQAAAGPRWSTLDRHRASEG